VTRAWIAAHKERLAYGLVAVLLLVTVGAGITAGVLLRHSANIQRQTLRLQELEEAVQLGEPDVRADYRGVRSHDRAAARRLGPTYLEFLGGGAPDRLEAQIHSEIERLGRDARDTYPIARAVLISAAFTSLLLIAVLIWQFEMQRRAGRIDRDNAERSKELARLRDELVGVVSHELRTPLTSILGFLDLIADDEDGELSADQQAYFDVIRRNADRLLYLVSDLLLVAESDNGRLRLDVQDVDLKALAHDSVDAARAAAGKKQIDLELSATPTRLHGDPLRLAQLMDNLISNAIKFTPEGGRVTVRTAARADHASLEVSDSGIGIAPADRDQIFERFFRVQAAAKGAGLGLAITKAIVDAHGGSISVESEVGSGTSFRIRLPRTPAPVQ
jgi:signal transduction histidine kinase